MKYWCLGEPAQSRFVVSRSEFLSFAIPVLSPEQVSPALERIRAEHHSATHHCSAWRCFAQGAGSSDDGEPSGTAGRPMLSAIERSQLYDVLVVTVRYFGGVKLGPRGLIDSYRKSVEDVLVVCKNESVRRVSPLTLTCSYEDLKTLTVKMKQIIDERPFSTEYLEHVTLTFHVEEELVEKVQSNLCEHEFLRMLKGQPCWGGLQRVKVNEDKG